MPYVIATLIGIILAQTAALVALAQARRKAGRETLEHARREAEARAIAHELNNTLSVILNYASFVLEDLPDGSPSRADVAEISRAAQQAGVLAHALGGCQEPRDAPEHEAPSERRAAA